MTSTGYFVIADVSGYTAFLTPSELDRAQEILRALFDSLLEHTRPPLRVSNFQGDAILAYVPDGRFVPGKILTK